MCGICGFSWEDKSLVRRMAESIAYRGPDQEGYYTDADVSLGHKRLSVIDTSQRGCQPMGNEDGTIQIVYNGEIYNFKEIRKLLEDRGHRFRTDTDTEVIIHAYEEYGKECVKKFNGMFAFAIWDAGKKCIFLARDRLGIKPLYYALVDGRLIFASEIKAILQHEAIARRMNANALSQIVDFLFPLGDDTLFEGVKELLPGHILEYCMGGAKIERYWKIEDKSENKSESYFAGMLENILKKSVGGMLISDVPLGAALSGGLDSSTVVALMSKASKGGVKTFTVGFGDEADEFGYAKMVAEHCGTEHHEIVIPFESVTAKLPEIMWHMETIITRSSTFPTYFYAKELKKNVTVALLGEGSDEVFAGYPRNRQFTAAAVSDLDNAYKRLCDSFFKEEAKKQLYTRNFYDSLERDKDIDFVKGYLKNANKSNILNRDIVFEIEKQLPGVHLLRVDRMTMAHAVEARVPYLDHNLVEFSMRIPSRLKIKGNTEKYILKKVASKYLPRQIIEREKLGLSTPVSTWFKEDFFEILPHILSEKNIMESGIFDYDVVNSFMKRSRALRMLPGIVHKLSGRMISKRAGNFLKDAYASKIWFLAMIIMWHKMFIEPESIRKPRLKIGNYF